MVAPWLLLLLLPLTTALTEEARVADHHKLYGAWDPLHPPWVPATKGWHALMERRAAQLLSVDTSQERWDGWTTLVNSGLVVRNFTHDGYKLASAPESITADLRDRLRRGLAEGAPMEEYGKQIDVIAGLERPMFVSVDEARTQEIMREMQPAFEEWAGVELVPVVAYGLRVYQSGATLKMHIDKTEDHVISAILHVDHSEDDAGDWPLVIEGFDGSTVEVSLRRGEMLFYESAKCLHGRPRPLNGKWYSSIFIHYKPKGWDWGIKDTVLAVPPHWRDERISDDHPKLKLTGTGFYEPDCPPHLWCALDRPPLLPLKQQEEATTKHRRKMRTGEAPEVLTLKAGQAPEVLTPSLSRLRFLSLATFLGIAGLAFWLLCSSTRKGGRRGTSIIPTADRLLCPIATAKVAAD